MCSIENRQCFGGTCHLHRFGGTCHLHHVPWKHQLIFNRPCGIISLKIELLAKLLLSNKSALLEWVQNRQRRLLIIHIKIIYFADGNFRTS
jgi:hypothetical protein